jgi:RHS repeat-associated protein
LKFIVQIIRDILKREKKMCVILANFPIKSTGFMSDTILKIPIIQAFDDKNYKVQKSSNHNQLVLLIFKLDTSEQTYKTAEYNRLISDNDSEYKYDLEGNRISKIAKDGSTIKYYWDNRNRLIKIETPNVTIEYIYYHQNRIVLRKQGETTTTFIHDGWQIILQFDNDKPSHRYLWGTKQDDLICDNDNWTLNDHLNTIRDIVKSDGTVTDHLEYNSFGKIISATKNDSSVQFAYTGKLTDKEIDLQWNINRWYDAQVGRWVSEDPIGFKGGDRNLARLVHNDVIAQKDPDGLAPQGYVLSGAKYCKAYHTSGIWSYVSSHTFLAVNGESFGFYQKNNNPIGPGLIVENEFIEAPENVSGESGFFSICQDIWIDGDCYDTKNFRDSMIEYKNFAKADPPFYVIGLMDCMVWATRGIGYSLNMSRKIKSEKVKCDCIQKYGDGDGFNYSLEY